MNTESAITNPGTDTLPQSSDLGPGTEIGPLWTARRFYIAVFLFFNLFINYMDRTALSMAGPVIANHFKWRPGTMGLLFSSFMWSYSLCLIPWGAMSDRIGTKRVSSISVTLWSVAAMLTSMSVGFRSMLSTRLALGIGESASLPMAAKVVRQWFPANERGLATAIFNTGTFAGPAIAAPFVAWLILNTGWRMSFVITGGIGLIWVALWLKFFDLPSHCSWLSHAERDYLASKINETAPSGKSVRATLFDLLGRRTMWGLCLTQGCCAYMMSMFLFWLPSYLTAARNMSLMKASWFTSVPYLVASALGVYIGRLSDAVLSSDSARYGKRRSMLMILMILSMAVLLINGAANELVVLFLISIALTCISGALSLNIALANDLVWNSEIAGTALGILILGGISFSLLAPIVTGYIVQVTGSFSDAFFLAGLLLLVGVIASFTMTRKPLSFTAPQVA
jgi:sugar phosphate permease